MQLGSKQPDWWGERISEWVSMGYQMDEVVSSLKKNPERASEIIILSEKNVATAEKLRNEILNMDERHAEQAVTWLHMLDDINNVEIVTEEVGRFNIRHRPWVIDARLSVKKWEERKMVAKLEHLISRLDALDPVFIAKGSLLAELFQNPDSHKELEIEIERLENSQELRWNNLENMVISLHEKGVDAEEVMHLDLSSAYERVSRLEILAEKITSISNEIAVGIAPFDLRKASSLEERLRNVDVNIEAEIISLSVEVNAVSTELDVRYLKMVNRLRDLTNSGFILPPEFSQERKHLLQMEEMIEGLEKRAHKHDQLIESVNSMIELWPELNEILLDIGGDLTRTEELELALADSEERIKSIRIKAEEQISSWSELGFEMSRWRSRFDDLPVQAMARWLEHLPILRSALELIRRLEDLDTSLTGKNEVENFVSRLQASKIEDDIFEEAENFLHNKGLRNKRHRRLLKNDIQELVVKGQLAEIELDANMSLKELENIVHSATMSIGISNIASTNQTTRLPVKAIQDEINLWGEMDWDVSGLNELLKSDPLAVGRMIDGIREEMQSLSDLTRRLNRLPLMAAEKTREEIIGMMRRPEALSTLRSKIPEFAAKAAVEADGQLGSHELWKPISVEEEEIVVEELDDMDVEVLHASIDEMYGFEIEGSEEENVEISIEEDSTDEVSQPQEIIPPEIGHSEIEVEDSIETVEFPSIIESPIENQPEANEVFVSIENEIENDGDATFETDKEMVETNRKITDETTPLDDNEKILESEIIESRDLDEIESESIVAQDFVVEQEIDEDLAEILREPLNRLLMGLGILGIKENLDHENLERVRFAIASKVGIKPRDARVDRLLKLALRLIPRTLDSDVRKRAGMISLLASSSEKLNEWAALRLRSRNATVGEGLLENSWNLGKTLSRIPGPGFGIPLEPDNYQLPGADELNKLAGEVAKLSGISSLSSSSGIKAL